MKKLMNLIENYEVLMVEGSSTTEAAIEIYAELIQLGYITSDLADENEVADILLVNFKYEFANEEILEELVMELTAIAVLDSLPAEVLQEMVDMIEKPDFTYVVSKISMDLDTGVKDTTVITHLFDSLTEVRDYVDSIGIMMAVEDLFSGEDRDTGVLELLAVEDAAEELDELGIEGMIIADQIPDEATAVMTLVTTNKDRDTIRSAEMFAIYELTK